MRQIKFRGEDFSLKGKLVYGVGFLPSTCAYDFLIMEDATFRPIEKHSVAQLAGYDSHGNEVYEGDKLTGSQGNKCIAKIDSAVEWQSNKTPVFRRAPFDFAKEFSNFTVEAKS